MSNAMFCYQCQETVGNKGCTQVGVCGKKPETSALQDVLIYVSKGLGQPCSFALGMHLFGGNLGVIIDFVHMLLQIFIRIMDDVAMQARGFSRRGEPIMRP